MTAALAAHDAVRLPDWPSAVRRAAEALVELGVATPDYPAACLRMVEQHGPYIVLSPGLALVHARPEDGGRGVGLVLLRLSEPVEFGHPDNDPVDLVFAFCSPNATEHVSTLSTVAAALAGGLTGRLRAAPDEASLTATLKGALADA